MSPTRDDRARTAQTPTKPASRSQPAGRWHRTVKANPARGLDAASANLSPAYRKVPWLPVWSHSHRRCGRAGSAGALPGIRSEVGRVK